MISIEICTLHGKYLQHVFESIRSQTFQDYEVIVVNSGPEQVSDLTKKYGFKVINRKAKLLHARYLAHKESKGDYSLLIDETRMLEKNTLEVLASLNNDMAIIGEKEVGDSLWIRLAQLDKENLIHCNPVDPVEGITIPRYFKSDLLSRSLQSALDKLGDIFYRVVFRDHDIIYYEASKISGDICVLPDPLILHFGDKALLDIVKKYYRYGRTARILKKSPYSSFLKRKRLTRKICRGGFWDRKQLYLLYLARGIPYFIGLALG